MIDKMGISHWLICSQAVRALVVFALARFSDLYRASEQSVLNFDPAWLDVPGEQAVHCEAKDRPGRLLHDPAGHADGVPAAARQNEPIGHEMQVAIDVAPVALLQVPLSQEIHSDEFAGLHLPAGHVIGDEAPRGQNEPSGHGLLQGTPKPVDRLHVPAAQAIQETLPAALQLPGGHSLQDVPGEDASPVDDLFNVVPAGHGVHDDEPSLLLNVPLL